MSNGIGGMMGSIVNQVAQHVAQHVRESAPTPKQPQEPAQPQTQAQTGYSAQDTFTLPPRNLLQLKAAPPPDYSVAMTPGAQQLSALETDLIVKTRRVEELNQKLSKHMSDLGPTLSKPQQEAYMAEFKRQNRYDEAIQAQKEAGNKLAAALAKTDLKEMASKGLANANVVMRSLKALGNAPGQSVMGLMAQVKDVWLPVKFPSPGERHFSSLFNADMTELAAKCMPNEYMIALEQTGDPKKALETVESQYKAFKGVLDVKSALRMAELIQKTPPSEFAQVLKQEVANGFNSRMGYSMAAVGIFFAMAKAGDGAGSGDLAKLVDGLADTGSKGAEIFTGLMTAMGRSARSGHVSALTRLAPGLGVVSSMASAMGKLSEFYKNSPTNAGLMISATGDMISAMGSGLQATLVGWPAGFALSTAGTVVTLLGDAMDRSFKGEQFAKEKEKVLKVLAGTSGDDWAEEYLVDLERKYPGFRPVRADMVWHYARVDGQKLKATVEDAGLEHYQLESLYSRYSNEVPSSNFATLAKLAGSKGVKGEAFMRMVDSFVQESGGTGRDFGNKLYAFGMFYIRYAGKLSEPKAADAMAAWLRSNGLPQTSRLFSGQ